ncbi:unnamed protein product [Ectocarpus sp. 6 AP-2014]
MASMDTKHVGEQQSTECTESIKSTDSAIVLASADSAIVLASAAAGGTGTVAKKTKYGVVDPNVAMVLDVMVAMDEKRDRRDEERERKNEERERVREQRMVDIVQAVIGSVTNIQSAVKELQENGQQPVDTTYAPFFRTERLKKVSSCFCCVPTTGLLLYCCCALQVPCFTAGKCPADGLLLGCW